MASAVDFKGANLTLTAAKGDEDRVREMKAFFNGNTTVSCWELSPEELEEVSRTGKVFVSILSGKTFFPMFVGNSESVRALVVDTGATFPKQEA